MAKTDGLHLTAKAKKSLQQCVINIREKNYIVYQNFNKDLTGCAFLCRTVGIDQRILTFHPDYQTNFKYEEDDAYVAALDAILEYDEDEEELKAIFERTFGPVKRYKEPQFKRTFSAKSDSGSYYRNSFSAKKKEKEYLLVDGYNIIYAWEDLKELADANLHAAQTKLMDILSNYQGFKKCTLILVFDAYKIEGHAEEVITYHNIHVVYTKEAETADQYIEKTVHKIGRENQVTVATSDGLEQIIIMGQGAHRMSARGLRDEIKATENQIRQQWHEKRQSSKNYLIDNISDEMAQYMKEKRLGKQ